MTTTSEDALAEAFPAAINVLLRLLEEERGGKKDL